jgi:hypothetical protein
MWLKSAKSPVITRADVEVCTFHMIKPQEDGVTATKLGK